MPQVNKNAILWNMSALGVYRRGFSLALSRELVYRVNFLLGRVREFIVYGSLLFLFQAIPQGLGRYTSEQAMSYLLISSLLSAPLFVYGMHMMAGEIADGDFTNYLLRPLNYFGYWASRLLASRALLFFGGLIELFILILLFAQGKFFIQTAGIAWVQVIVLFIGSLILVQLIDFIGALLSFWTNRGHGPRWMMTIFIQLLSGAYLPLDLIPPFIKRLLFLSPFPTMIYGPVKAYLGQLSPHECWILLLTQWIWILFFGVSVFILWKRGVRIYEAYGR